MLRVLTCLYAFLAPSSPPPPPPASLPLPLSSCRGQIKLLNLRHPTLQRNLQRDYEVQTSALESNPNILYLSSSGGLAMVEPAMLQIDAALGSYEEASLQLDSALLVPAKKFIETQSKDVLMIVDGEELTNERLLQNEIDMDMEKSSEQPVIICSTQTGVVNDIRNALNKGPFTQQLSLRVNLLNVMLENGDLQLETIAEANGVAFSLWLPEGARQGTLRFVSWLQEDVQAAVATVNVTIMAENKVATRDLSFSQLRQKYLFDCLYTRKDQAAVVAFDGALKDSGQVQAEFKLSDKRILITGPKYKTAILEKNVLAHPDLLGRVHEEHFAIQAPESLHQFLKENAVLRALTPSPLVVEISLPSYSSSVHEMSGRLCHARVVGLAGSQHAALSVGLCGKQDDVKRAVEKVKVSFRGLCCVLLLRPIFSIFSVCLPFSFPLSLTPPPLLSLSLSLSLSSLSTYLSALASSL